MLGKKVSEIFVPIHIYTFTKQQINLFKQPLQNLCVVEQLYINKSSLTFSYSRKHLDSTNLCHEFIFERLSAKLDKDLDTNLNTLILNNRFSFFI